MWEGTEEARHKLMIDLVYDRLENKKVMETQKMLKRRRRRDDEGNGNRTEMDEGVGCMKVDYKQIL